MTPAPGRAARGATIVAREDLTPSIAFFRVLPDGETAPFAPGQYVTLGIQGADGPIHRAYSVASSARRLQDGYELYVRLVPHGALTPLLFAALAGQRVWLRPPKGRFVLGADDDRVHLFVATGCGIAPFMSMIRTLRDDGRPRRVILLHGVSYASELGYHDELEELAADPGWRLVYVPTISRPSDPANACWPGQHGRVEAVLREVCDTRGILPSDAVAFLCGNPGMVTEGRSVLWRRGFAHEQIREEMYWPGTRR
ncbi:MAG TPA: FAD-binding oxidoreductase [Candidatus Limnocylindrales bacterium]|nr:FAD-binding oxidoreductase [Candidatus Limnocylindrales bacterium]